LRRRPHHLRQGWISGQKWDLIVLDEAQAIKNPATRQAKAVKALQGRARLALTGTTVENRLGDLWSLFDFLSPGLLGSATRFKTFINKYGRLRVICEEIASRGEKVLVFSQFRGMALQLTAFLGGVFGRSGLVLHGGTPVAERQRNVERFQHEDGPPFLVLSLKAGGTGLKLTAASQVIHFDRW
jgi:SNF2 family DNA or RNA helicase